MPALLTGAAAAAVLLVIIAATTALLALRKGDEGSSKEHGRAGVAAAAASGSARPGLLQLTLGGAPAATGSADAAAAAADAAARRITLVQVPLAPLLSCLSALHDAHGCVMPVSLPALLAKAAAMALAQGRGASQAPERLQAPGSSLSGVDSDADLALVIAAAQPPAEGDSSLASSIVSVAHQPGQRPHSGSASGASAVGGLAAALMPASPGPGPGLAATSTPRRAVADGGDDGGSRAAILAAGAASTATACAAASAVAGVGEVHLVGVPVPRACSRSLVEIGCGIAALLTGAACADGPAVGSPAIVITSAADAPGLSSVDALQRLKAGAASPALHRAAVQVCILSVHAEVATPDMLPIANTSAAVRGDVTLQVTINSRVVPDAFVRDLTRILGSPQRLAAL